MGNRDSIPAPVDHGLHVDAAVTSLAESRFPYPGSRILASDYQPPWWLRNPHLQSTLASSPMRLNLGVRAIAATGAVSTAHIVDGGDGVRLNGFHSVVPGREPRGLALLLHGWEGSTESLGGVLHEMRARLHAGHSVGVFPEGRTRDGHEVGPFHARIFLAAVEAGVPVQPVALRYGAQGDAQTRVAFQPGEHFFGNFLRLLGEPARPVEVHFLEPIVPSQADGRRRIAELARERIVAAMAS